MDVVITFGDRKYIVELKKWYGEKVHREGLEQLTDYLERQGLDMGYLIIYDTRRKSSKLGKSELVTVKSRRIFTVWV